MKKLIFSFYVLLAIFLFSCKMGQDKFFDSGRTGKQLIHFSASIPDVNQNAKSVNSQSATYETYSDLNSEQKFKYILTGSATIDGKTQRVEGSCNTLSEISSIELPLEAGNWTFELKAVLTENESKVVLKDTKSVTVGQTPENIIFQLKEVAGKGSVNLTIKLPLNAKNYMLLYNVYSLSFTSSGMTQNPADTNIFSTGQEIGNYYQVEYTNELNNGLYSLNLVMNQNSDASVKFEQLSIIFAVHNSLVTTVVSTNNDINQQYSVTYSLDGSAGEEFLQSPVRSLNSSMTYTLPTRSTVQKPGFTFKGWQKDGTDISVLQNVQENITLTPVWEPNTKVYVSSSGDDLNPGTSDSPVKTMKRAIYLLNKDATDTGTGIYIKDTYTVSDADKDGWSLNGYSSQKIWRDDSLTSGSVINIPAGKTLMADHITFEGNSPFSNTTGSLNSGFTATNQEYLSVSGIAILSNVKFVKCYNKTDSGASSSTSGAAIRTYGKASLILSDFSIQFAYAKTGSAAIYTDTSSGNRPVIQLTDGYIQNCYNNTSSSNATAVTVNTEKGTPESGFSTKSYIKGVQFKDNKCIADSSSGGAVQVYAGAYFSFINCSFQYNQCRSGVSGSVARDIYFTNANVYLSGNPTACNVYFTNSSNYPLNVSNLTGTNIIKLTLSDATPKKLVSGSTDISFFELTNTGYHLKAETSGSAAGIYMEKDDEPITPGLTFEDGEYKIKMVSDLKPGSSVTFNLYKGSSSTPVDVSSWTIKLFSGATQVPVVTMNNTITLPSDVVSGDAFVLKIEAVLPDSYTVHGSFPIIIQE
ncbi:MAG: hypothetical protein MJ160_00115 [Treponema sp.]|nr:hypothetical protein [Treponema sp.]